ncbi:Uncharacterised protein [Enterobacter hormaechei]|nr:Uncharacterised protein [Enterobacter hormaechei]SAA10565.1 Uncharacterised protein [Enterobacter hormaechei]SAA89174.1 Uncharacterised protein [Enterobacter hormaechei]SAB04314.1 Uncharacterised protein [Enterobacter hormaechei]
MYDKYTLNRCDAMEWLAEHSQSFQTRCQMCP